MVGLGCLDGIGLAAPSHGRETNSLTIKILCVAVVLLLASLAALICGNVLLALGATKLTAIGSGGGAFLGVSGLGMLILGYLLPAS
ncbi:hypothetical protein STANM337S_01948 [Streptomyces tanashiensis]